MQIYFRKLKPDALLPVRATASSAGADLCACLDAPVSVPAGKTVMIPLGIASQPSEEKIAMLVFPRSGLASRYGITLANAVGVIDSDYRGEWMIPLHNTSDTAFVVEHGMRIAQLLVVPVYFPEILEADSLNKTERGISGFGSTGMG